MTPAAFAYLGAIVLGPVIPLAVYLLSAGRSPFLRYHAGKAVNLSVTGILYAVCCLILGGLLALDSVTAALALALPIAAGLWACTVRYLIGGVIAANRGERYEAPSWICARIVN